MGLDVRKPRSLISALVIPLSESIISRLAMCKISISIFKLVSVAEQAGLNLTLSETPDRFCSDEAHMALK